MHSFSIVGAELCLKMSARKGLAETTSRPILCIGVYLRISMSSAMAVAGLCIRGL